MSWSTKIIARSCSETNGAFPPLIVKADLRSVSESLNGNTDTPMTTRKLQPQTRFLQTSSRQSTMFYARSVVLYALLCICSTNYSKIKNASIPVRLFTEEELQRYDGSEVCAVSQKHCASFISTFRNYVLID